MTWPWSKVDESTSYTILSGDDIDNILIDIEGFGWRVDKITHHRSGGVTLALSRTVSAWRHYFGF